jgi:hypothetical protein
VDKADYSMDPTRVLGGGVQKEKTIFIKNEQKPETLDDLLQRIENPLEE